MWSNSPRNWHGYRHGGNWWIAPLVILGLIILTRGWILVVPLMLVGGFIVFGIVLPRICRTSSGKWGNTDWSWRWDEKRKRGFREWDEKPKRDDDIEYV